jgi:rhomboid protease GluP
MTADASGRELSFPITYEAFAGNAHNADFRGKGRLVIRPEGPAYVFSGTKRERFTARHDLTLELGVADIWNVVTEGRIIRFRTARGESGRQGKLFLFLCGDAAEAAAVAALLPAHKDAEFHEARDFSARLFALPGATSPWTSATHILIGLNAAVFIVMGCLGAGWFTTESMLPYVLYGANNGGATTDGEWWRLVTCMFMHYGFIHLAMNMWALFQTGHLVERLLGRALYTLTYLGSGIIAGLASILWHGDKIWSAGASGAIFGVYGALLGYMLREKHALPRSVFQPILKSTLVFAGYNILYGLALPRIDNSAHVGGFLSGITLGWLVALPVDPAARARLWWPRMAAGLAAIAAACVAGYYLTPRYDYRVRDELAWTAANETYYAREESIARQTAAAVTELVQGRNREAHARWLAAEAVPFYEDWARRISGLELAPEKITARYRAALLRIIRLRLDNFRQLIAGLNAGEAGAVDRYVQADARVAQEISRLGRK